MELPPWEYLFLSFNSANFEDMFFPTVVAAAIMLVGVLALYLVRTRQLRHHPPYLALYEWLLWSGVAVYGGLIVSALFVFDFIIPLGLEIVGLGVMVWIRFVRFPPLIAAYEQRLARQRYFSRERFSHPETTIRPKAARRRRRRR
ncbi:MAG TPA: hypothetical protein VLA23_07775 [Candidatus Limnocylindrales bacterium]|nr:hypothetical protein [Candidatus Limnocylindrales bacterium]